MISANTHKLIPSDPMVDFCPAPASDTEFSIDQNQVRLTEFETPKFSPSNGIVAGVIGPLSCDLCFNRCDDAYYGLSATQVNLIREVVKPAETPVNIGMLSDSAHTSPETADITRDIRALQHEGTLLALNGDLTLIPE